MEMERHIVDEDGDLQHCVKAVSQQSQFDGANKKEYIRN